ncbi:hypothetical protein FACS1894139_02920 [Planctomycetales bacterium]|nr:hypothetical protein FACS1894107_11410 [Planctomycetales bacterium]GHT00695.1 hypothetical protein FACS1894108_13360 [Planctomycetales bacterium]GHT03198.1 hypothetical protein FACS1894139_02920 [Planctomycetales bacterium]
MAKADGHLCHLNTNGKLLDDKLIEQLLTAGLDSIKFSFQGVDEKSYSEMRQGGGFAVLVAAIEKMFNMRGDNLSPYMHISTTTTYESVDIIDDFKKKMQAISDLVTVGRTKLEHIDANKANLRVEQKDLLAQLKLKQSLTKRHPRICPEVFGKLSIDWDGKVSACCQAYNRQMTVGDINRDSLTDIFHNEKISHYRQLLSRGEFEMIDFCRQCWDYMEIQTGNQTGGQK